MRLSRTGRAAGFSLVELVIVIVIIGVIAAIAIPRVTRATKGAGESALSSDLAILRNAIEMYASEHNGVYPGVNKVDGSAGGAELDFKAQLTKYTNTKGKTSDVWDKDYPFGPYLRKGIPPLPIGGLLKGDTEIKFDSATSPPTATDADAGWLYNPSSGEIIGNCTESDDAGKGYDEY
jgi:general secretion pathway protein G